MKIVLHIGLSKTGTTSLQMALFNARESLLDRGVLYPDGGDGHENHLYLCPLFMKPEDLPRSVKRRSSAKADAEAMWSRIRSDIDKTQPKIMVLSSEYFFIRPKTIDYVAFRRRLAEVSEDIDVVLYVREPASRFASLVQQGAKSNRPPPAFDGNQLRRELPLVEDAFGAPVDVRLFDRAALIDHDVVRDFLARSVEPIAGPISAPSSDENESVSAEATTLLMDESHGPGIARVREALGISRYRDLVRTLDDQTPGKKAARLRPEVADDLRRASSDLIWLRDRYGVTFPGIEYARVDGVAPTYETAPVNAAALMTVDPERLSVMAAAIGATSWRSFGLRSLPRRMMSLFW